ncbi:hypothetical protein GCM10010207_23570 [Streptomyces atratus]|nr:hypothetical protein GCM10010207_23570 [Streptomyces atratus]
MSHGSAAVPLFPEAAEIRRAVRTPLKPPSRTQCHRPGQTHLLPARTTVRPPSHTALRLLRRAAVLGGAFGRDAQVGIIDQLYALGRETEVEAQLPSMQTTIAATGAWSGVRHGGEGALPQ